MTLQARTIAELIAAGNELTSLTATDTFVVERGAVQYGINLLNAGILPPVGSAVIHFGTTPPPRCLAANGAAVSRTTYGDLFAAIGTTWGAGDGLTTFNLPDAEGRHLEGSGLLAVGEYAAQSIEGHAHGVNDPGHWHRVTGNFNVSGIGQFSEAYLNNLSGTGNVFTSTRTTGISVQSNGGAVTRPASLGVLICIRYAL